MKINKIYESASSDGYQTMGDGLFFRKEHEALAKAEQKHGSGHAEVLAHDAIEAENGQYFILKSTKSVSLFNSEQFKKELIENARKKLTPAELEALGLNV
jgi:hypothetical protein